jgi:hypothetical protein
MGDEVSAGLVLEADTPGVDTKKEDASSFSSVLGRFRRSGGSAGSQETDPAKARLLKWVRAIGLLVIFLDFLAMASYSHVVYGDFALTRDYSTYAQGWWLVAHGHLDPYSSVLGHHLWRNDLPLVFWALSVLWFLWPHGITLLWAQDLAIAGSLAVVFWWGTELAAGYRLDGSPVETNASKASSEQADPDLSGQSPGIADDQARPGGASAWRWQLPLLSGLLLAMLVANPWVWWTSSNDVHVEPFGVLLALLAARALCHRKPSGWVWAGLTLLVSTAVAPYILGVAILLVIVDHKRWASALLLGLGSIGWVVLVALLGGMKSPGLVTLYSHLASTSGNTDARMSIGALLVGILVHPQRILTTLFHRWRDIWNNVLPVGVVGFLSPLGPWMALVVLANTLPKIDYFAGASFQSFPLYAAMPLGTVWTLTWLWRHVTTWSEDQRFSDAVSKLRAWASAGRNFVAILLPAAILSGVLWGAVSWFPITFPWWVPVSQGASAVLAKAEPRIPENAEVIASLGVAGRFALRPDVQVVTLPGPIPVNRPKVFFVLTFLQGVSTLPGLDQLGLLGNVEKHIGARRVIQGHGIYVYEWNPPPGTRTIVVPNLTKIPITGNPLASRVSGP